jgi:dihydroxy-acid dehydratase
MAMGGSTNAIIHVVAMARRAGIALDMQRFDELSRQVPVLANVRPSGKYLMEDFFYAGGLRALMTELKDELDLSCLTVTGKTVGENIAGAQVYLRDVIHPMSDPIYAEGATAVLKGNLAPRGCVMKPAAADKRFLKHRGPALAFEDYNHMAREIERDDLDITPDHVLVLKNAGPKGGPGMPEWGMLPIPKRLVTAGVRDMLRVSDGRMSGTSYGACILHVAPESYVGGPLALVETGDMIEVDVAARRIHLGVGEEELARRRAAWRPPAPRYERGYGVMFSTHIGQADDGCDFDFLGRGAPTPEPEIH